MGMLCPDSKEIQGVVEKVFKEAGVDQDEEVRTQTDKLRTQLEKENLLPKTVYQGKVEGSGALAQGEGSTAAGAGGLAVGGDVHGNVSLGGTKPEAS